MAQHQQAHGLHAQALHQEGPLVRPLGDLLGRGLARAVAGVGLDAGEHGGLAGLGGLQGGGELVAVGGHDPVIVKAFVSMLGIYPVGTFVVLDSFELAIVQAVNPDPVMLSRPTVIIVSDDLGNVKHPGEIVNLADTDEAGNFRRTIIKTADPERYGIRVGDYFV